MMSKLGVSILRSAIAPGVAIAALIGATIGCSGTDALQAIDTTAEFSSPVDLNAPRPNDRSERRVVVLDNSLEALLVSDPTCQKSAAALDVAVGSLEDPWNAEGMAHFLEHLLFLGTEKYPEVEDYDRYISSNQGRNNAYTAGTRTNYYFEVTHDAFEGGLDRFSQFFVAPLFNPDYVERERNAVHSEHQKNLQDDFWRTRMVHRLHHRNGHPRQKFSTGDLSTLEGATREAIIEFYDTYYSANQMKLCLITNRSLDEMEAMVREKFSAVPNRDRADLEYPSDVFAAADLPMWFEVEPVTDMRTLQLTFATPNLDEWYASKPHRLWSALVGHEGEGSLLALLERENLATALGAYPRMETYAGSVNVDITLTDAGRAATDRVIAMFFAYIDMLRDSGLSARYFQEAKTVTDLSYFFRDHQEGGQVASSYAAAMQTHPADAFEKRQQLLTKFAPDQFQTLLGWVTPDRVRATLTAPDVEGDRVEDHYGTEYSLTRVDDARVARWVTEAAAIRASGELRVPDENPFLPDALTLLQDDPHDAPYRLIDDERGVVWFEQDKTFDVPRASVSLLLLTEATNASPRERLVAQLYEACVSEALGEWIYPVYEAGLYAGLSTESRGVRLAFSGYSQRIPELMDAFTSKIRTVDLAADRYRAVQDELVREFANAELDQAYSQVFYEMAIFMNPDAIHRDSYAAMVNDITLDDVQAFAARVFERAAIEGVAYGNLDGAELRAAIDGVYGKLVDSPLPRDRRPRQVVVALPDGQPLVKQFSSRTDNNCWARFVQFGERSPRLEAVLRVGANYLEPGFYGEMRSKQQLGYIVFSGPSLRDNGIGMYFLIQSGTYGTTELASRANPWIIDAVAGMTELTDDAFATIRDALISELEEEDRDITERMATIQFQGLRLNDFEYDQKVIAELRALSAAEVAREFQAVFEPGNTSRMDLYLDAVEAERGDPLDPVTQDLVAVRNSLPTY